DGEPAVEPAVEPAAWPPALGTGPTPTAPTAAAPAEPTPPISSAPVGPAWLAPATPALATPGMYLPPSLPPVEVRTPNMAGLPAPARAWAGTSAAAGAGARSSTAADQIRLSDQLHGAEAIGWVGVAGAAIAAVGFLLPWSASVIGADGVGYFDRWGFAGPGHVLVVVAILAVLALAFVKNPIPAWARLGIPGLILGSLLVGLVWPYVFGLSGAQVGAPISLIGGLVLVAAATACLATDRHASSASAV
ncbi:MAG: hypothetical protein ABIQ58_01120, partial [Candidatus Limnocylindrales bacterium]